jgi:hypothetical protein
MAPKVVPLAAVALGVIGWTCLTAGVAMQQARAACGAEMRRRGAAAARRERRACM